MSLHNWKKRWHDLKKISGPEVIKLVKMLMKTWNFAVKQVLTETNHFLVSKWGNQ